MFPNYRKFHLSHFFFQNQGDAGDGTGSGDNSNGDQSNTTETFESWLEKQPDEIKAKAKPLFTAHIEKLKNTVKATREERDDFSNQLRDATNKLAKDSDERKRLEAIADQYDEQTRRADFYEQSLAEGCHNPKAAYAIAKSEELFTKSGAPNWAKIKETVPEFFGEGKKVLPKKKTAGSGTGEEPPSSETMNDWIRREANKRTIVQS